MRKLILVLGLVTLSAGCCRDRCSSCKVPVEYMPPASVAYPPVR